MSPEAVGVFGTLGGVVLGFAGAWWLQNLQTRRLAEGIRLQLGAALLTVGVRMQVAKRRGAQPFTDEDWQAPRLHDIAYAPETASALAEAQLLGVLTAARQVMLSEASIRYAITQLRGGGVNVEHVQENIRSEAATALGAVNSARQTLGLRPVPDDRETVE